MLKRYSKQKKYFFILFFILIFNLISITLLSNNILYAKKQEVNSSIYASSNGPPDKVFFKYFKEITIDHSLVSGTGSHENFPVLISIFDSDLHDDVQSKGNDIAFAMSENWLDYEIEYFNPAYNSTHAQLIAWVRIPSLSTSMDTKFYMYYSNSTMGPHENPEGVWESRYQGVWHLSENPTGMIYDSTSNNRDCSSYGSMTSGDLVTGQIDGSLDFDGTDDYIQWSSVINQTVGTYSMWIYPHSVSGERNFIADNAYRRRISLWDDIVTIETDTDAEYFDFDQSSITVNTWNHIFFVREGDIGNLYVNGTWIQQVEVPGADFLTVSCIGGTSDNTRMVDGLIDEVRISNNTYSNDWIATEYNNQLDTSNFYIIGRENSISEHPPDAHYFAYYKEIIIDHSKVSGSNDLLNFSVLISLLDTDLHDDVQSNGNDIAFAHNAAWLDHEIELFNQTYNSTHAQFVAWIRLPRLSTSWDTVIQMYYGNSTMSAQENPEGVWDSSYNAVWHLSENPSGTIYDSTSNDKDGISAGSMTSDDQIVGKINGGLDFDGTDDTIDLGLWNYPTDFNASSGTFSFWIRREFLDSELVDQYVLQTKNSGSNRIFFRFDGAGADWRFQHEGSDIQNVVKPGAGDIPKSQWIYVVQSWDLSADFLRGYVNGTFFGSIAGLGTPVTGSYEVSIASNGGSSDFFYGGIDEVRISDTPRADGWIKTEFNNQDDPISFYSTSKEYTLSGIPSNEKFFKHYKEIVIDHTMVSGTDDLINFPLLISTYDLDLRTKVQADGDDIAFSFKGAWLDHEHELFDQTYNSSHAQLVTWVSIPRLSASINTIIRMYYGNSSMSSRENPTGVWSKNYNGVWHLSESAGSALDSTSYSTAGSISGTVIRDSAGKIDGAYNFGNIGQINFGNPPDGHFNIGTGSFTISFWLNLDDTTGNYQIPLYKGATTDSEVGYDFETNTDASALSFRVCDGTSVISTSNIDIEFDNWIYLVGVIDKSSDLIYLYENGLSIDYGTSITGSANFDSSIPLRAPYSLYDLDGLLDEIRISNIARSPEWIATEYNNQYNPLTFLSIGSEISFDTTPPTFANLIESSDPLELGNVEIITINVTDPSGINQVQIDFEGNNHSMTNIWANAWQYDTWIPGSVDNYTYMIWMEDNYYNWNSTIGTIEVIDTTSPTFSDLIESADSLQLGQNETITIKVFDNPGSGVNQVLLEYDSSNHTMGFIGGNTWSWSKWKPTSLGIHPYTVYMRDMEDNWNITSGTIDVVSTTAPVIENLTKSPETLELGNDITIFVDVDDNETYVSTVLIELENVNYTMNGPVGTTYNYTLTRSWVGTVLFTIYANDSADNWASFTNSFDIVDTTPPALENLIESADPLEFGNTVIITLNTTDLSDVVEVRIEYQDPDSIIRNHTMSNIIGNLWQYGLWTPYITGNCSYTIWAIDNNTNVASLSDSISVKDTILPVYSDLTESAKVVELGNSPTISINCTDLAGIKDVLIECENSNNTMTNIGGDIWQYSSWMPISIGNYSYKIFIIDNNDNVNFANSSIFFQDTIIPTYSNMFENADPLELGDNQIIRIDVYDIAGINQALIEFEGANHSMINIYGNTWQYDSWTPSNWIIYQYKIHMEDLSGNWNSIEANLTVQDTTAPLAPTLTNSPSGDVSGILVFDWLDGSDPSGISYYILIIDNETNPVTTPGYIYYFNITNEGSQSSFCQLPEILPLGQYYFFLYQIDGVGHQSADTMGSFNVIELNDGSENNLLIYIIIGIIGASVAGLIATATIVRKRTKKEVLPQRKKLPLKMISTHINKLSKSLPSIQSDEFIGIHAESTEILTEEVGLESKIDEYKQVGEELFEEGAYLEAQKYFINAKELLLKLGKNEEANFLSELTSGIEKLIEERERRTELLEQAKIEGNSIIIYENFYDLIGISKKLRDSDAVSMYKSELIQYFQMNRSKIIDLERHRNYLEQEAESFINNKQLKIAAQVYEACENISQLFVQLDMDEEVANIEKFRIKKANCLNRILSEQNKSDS